MQLKCLFRRL